MPTTSHTGELRCSHTFAVRVAPLHTHTRVLGHELAPARIRDGVDANPHSTGASSPASLHCQHGIASSPAAVPALCLDSGFHGAGWGPGGLQPVALVPSPATLAQGTGQRLRPGVGASCRQESPVPVGGRWSSLGHGCAEGRKARSRVAQARAGGAALAPVLFTLEREDRRCLGGTHLSALPFASPLPWGTATHPQALLHPGSVGWDEVSGSSQVWGSRVGCVEWDVRQAMSSCQGSHSQGECWGGWATGQHPPLAPCSGVSQLWDSCSNP